MAWLQSSAWAGIGVIATIVVGFTGVCVTLWTRNRKALSYEVLSDVPIIAVRGDNHKAIAEGIEIRYQGSLVKDVRVVIVRIWNSGNVPIIPSDYEKPISIAFDGQLLGFEALGTRPTELQQDIITGVGSSPDHSGIELRSVLLNSKDSVAVQAVLTNFGGSVDVRARLIGVSSVRRLSRSQLSEGQLVWGLVAGTAGALTAIMSLVLPGGIREAAGIVGGLLLGTSGVIVWPYVKRWRTQHVW